MTVDAFSAKPPPPDQGSAIAKRSPGPAGARDRLLVVATQAAVGLVGGLGRENGGSVLL